MNLRYVARLSLGAIVVVIAVVALAVSQPTRPATQPGSSSSAPALVAGSSAEPPSTATVEATSPARTNSVPPTGPTAVPTVSAGATLPAATCCFNGPTPVPGETLAESNGFWDEWSDYPFDGPVLQADSLADNVDQAHLVVRGHIAELYIGETFDLGGELGTVPVAYARVAISEVLKGVPISRELGFVEVQLGRTSQEIVDKLSGKLPQHDNVWFLMHVETVRPRIAPNQSEIAPFAYFPTNDLQGVLRDIDGKVRVIKPKWTEELSMMGPGYFPLQLEGTSFEELVAQVAELGEAGPEATAVAVP